MDALKVEPGVGIGPVKVGMSREQVMTAAAAAGLDCRSVRRWSDRPEVLMVADQTQAYFGPDGLVDQVEAATSGPSAWRYGAIDLGEGSPRVKAELDGLAEPDASDPEFPASFCYPAIGLCL